MDSIIREQLASFSADDSSSAVAVNKDIINPKEPGRSIIFVYAKRKNTCFIWKIEMET